MHDLPIEPAFYYCRHDAAAARHARLDYPNHRGAAPSALFVSDGQTVYVFTTDSATPEARAIVRTLTRHFNDTQPDGPPLRLVPVNNRYWTAEPLGEGSPNATARLLHLIADNSPKAAQQRRQIIERWQRLEIDHHHNEEA